MRMVPAATTSPLRSWPLWTATALSRKPGPDISETVSAEEAARREEAESALIAEIGETVTLYPRRMGAYPQDFFRTELGDDLWQALLAQADSPGAGVQVDL